MSLGEDMKLLLIVVAFLSEKGIAPPVSKGQFARQARLPSHLPERLSVGIGTEFGLRRSVAEASQGRSLRLSG
jgi:hypothetical protein